LIITLDGIDIDDDDGFKGTDYEKL